MATHAVPKQLAELPAVLDCQRPVDNGIRAFDAGRAARCDGPTELDNATSLFV
ncbi:MAG: hypothetical protein OXL38_01550 [Gammaproteobacteria bacterium]|nr:hypothetical protein [Gammaproteobacteria bacterium]